MRIKLENDDGSEIVTYEDVVDSFISVRRVAWFARSATEQPLSVLESKSDARGNLREILKEMRQSVVELEQILMNSPGAPCRQ